MIDTPCALERSLLEAVAKAARQAASGDVAFVSPACPDAGALGKEKIPVAALREAFERAESPVANGAGSGGSGAGGRSGFCSGSLNKNES